MERADNLTNTLWQHHHPDNMTLVTEVAQPKKTAHKTWSLLCRTLFHCSIWVRTIEWFRLVFANIHTFHSPRVSDKQGKGLYISTN